MIPNPTNPCPTSHGADTNFGSAPNLFTAEIKGIEQHLVGAGQKSGIYWAVDRDTGIIVWSTQIGTGGRYGGTEYGTATNGKRIYISESNTDYVSTKLVSGKQTNGGYWSALEPATGKFWQTPATALAVNGAEFAPTAWSLRGYLTALSALRTA